MDLNVTATSQEKNLSGDTGVLFLANIYTTLDNFQNLLESIFDLENISIDSSFYLYIYLSVYIYNMYIQLVIKLKLICLDKRLFCKKKELHFFQTMSADSPNFTLLNNRVYFLSNTRNGY